MVGLLALFVHFKTLLTLYHVCGSGIFVKWFAMDCLCVSAEGLLVLTSLDGAVATSSDPINTSESGQGQHAATHHDDDTNTFSEFDAFMGQGGHSSSKHSSKRSKQSAQQANINNLKSQTPSAYTDTQAPEVVFGSSATPASTAYTAALACSYILSGKLPIKVMIVLLRSN
jgi:hypothetical protein